MGQSYTVNPIYCFTNDNAPMCVFIHIHNVLIKLPGFPRMI